eukprot:1043774-Heterocapsa_arctica.AAC.1
MISLLISEIYVIPLFVVQHKKRALMQHCCSYSKANLVSSREKNCSLRVSRAVLLDHMAREGLEQSGCVEEHAFLGNHLLIERLRAT